MNRKTIKTKSILIIFLLCVLFIILYKMSYISQFRNKFALSSELVILDGEEATIISLSDGKRKTVPFSEVGEYIDETEFITNAGKIYYKESDTFRELLSTEFEVEQRPIVLGDTIYFMAEEPNDSSFFPDNYLWKYQNGNIEKAYSRPLVNANAILSYDSKILFVENDDNTGRILCLDTISGEIKEVCSGDSICWKEDGKSFFYAPETGYLAVFDLDSLSSTFIGENIDIFASPVYNEEENVLLVFCHNEYSSAYPAITTAFYYLDSNEYVYFSKYLKNMNAIRTNDCVSDLALVYWE